MSSPGRESAVGAGRIVFLDVDGTLVGEDGLVPPSAAAAIRAARAAGHLVFLCTGRSLAELWSPILSIGFDGVVAASGSYVEVGGLVLCHRTIPGDRLRRAAAFFEADRTPVYFQANDAIYATSGTRDHLREMIRNALMARDGRVDPDDTLLGFVESIRTDADPFAAQVMKLVYFGASATPERLIAEFGTDFEVVRAAFPLLGNASGELSLRGVHKAFGMDVVLAHLGRGRGDTIAIGDSYNDLEMFEHAAISVAMADAPHELRLVADHVTGTPEQDGVEAAFHRLGLIR